MLSNYGRDLITGLISNTTTMPSTLYMALLKTSPTSTDTGSSISEPSGGSYARSQIANTSLVWTAPSGGLIKYTLSIAWPTPTADWGTIVAWAACTAAQGGQVVLYDLFSSPITVVNGRQMIVNPYSLTVTLRGVS